MRTLRWLMVACAVMFVLLLVPTPARDGGSMISRSPSHRTSSQPAGGGAVTAQGSRSAKQRPPTRNTRKHVDRVDPRFVRDPATGSVGPRRPMDMFFKPPPVCDKWIARARAYEQEVQAPYAATGAGSKGAMVHVFDRKDAGGYGSWLKGLVTMYIAAVLRGVPYSVVADSPPLERLFTSAHFVARDLAEKRDGAYFARVKPLRVACVNWMPGLGYKAEHLVRAYTNISAGMDKLFQASVGGGRLFVVCDRNLIPLMQQDSVMGPALDAMGLGRERYPADVYGCAFHTLMQPKQHVVEQAKRAVWRHGYFLGVQVRRGGSGVPWSDPSRIARKSETDITSCVRRYIAEFHAIRSADRRGGRSSNQHLGVFLTTDSPSIYGSVSIASRARIAFKPHLFFHTARSKVDLGTANLTGITVRRTSNETSSHMTFVDPYIELDEKVAIDHLIFAFADEKLGTRSAFSETAVWASFSSAVTRYVHDVCLHAPGPDCAATVTLC